MIKVGGPERPRNVADTAPAPVAILNPPVSVCVPDAVNRTVVKQVALGANEAVQVVLTKVKPLPVTDAAVGTVTGSAALPGFLSALVRSTAVPATCVPKSMSARIGKTPLPETATCAVVA